MEEEVNTTEPTMDVVTEDDTEAKIPTKEEIAKVFNDEPEEEVEDTGSEDKQSEDKSDKQDKPEDDLEKQYKKQLEEDIKLDKPVVAKVKGELFKIDSLKEVKDLVEKGIDYTVKSQLLAEDRRLAESLRNMGIGSVDELQAFLQGNYQVNPEALNPEPVEPKVESNPIEQVAESILNSEYADEVKQSIGELPEPAKEILSKDARILQGFYEDVKQGIAQKIIPLAKRYMMVNGMSFIDAYVQAGNQVVGGSNKGSNKQILNSEPKGNVDKALEDDLSDIDPMDDVAMEKYFRKLQNKYKK